MINQLWAALAKDSRQLAERAFQTHLGHLVPFFETCLAHGQGELLKNLWVALAAQSERLAAQAATTPLGQVAVFFETCLAHGQGELLKNLWAALAAQSERLAAQAATTPLEQVAVFFETCLTHGQVELLKDLWASLAVQPERFSEQVAMTPLHSVASFTAKAEEQATLLDEAGKLKQTQLIELLWMSLVNDPEKLAKRIQQLDTGNLADFLEKAPDIIAQTAIRSLDSAKWPFTVASPQPLQGGAYLAIRFGELGRADLQHALTENLLRRANWKDFPEQRSGLYGVAVLLAHVPDTAREAVPTFLDALCTPKSLGWRYTNATCGVLASALRLLAFHQAPAVLRRFHNYNLGVRLKKELVWFAARELRERHQVIQLLGTAYLLGAPGDRQWFAKLPLAEVARLLTEALPHRPEAIKVEDWQLHLWLGLRVIATQAYSPLVVDNATLTRTLELWRANLAETSPSPNVTAHRVNQSMVEWLERCVSFGHGLLIPNHEPLWTLAGFRVSGA